MPFSKDNERVIANFLGLPSEAASGSKRGPVSLDSLLVVLKEQYKLEAPSPERVLVENWGAIFGEGLAGRCHPVRIRNGHTLMVSVSNPTLRAELQFKKRSILARIRKLEHCEAIEDIVCRG